ncbi:MAG TPA: hypothetical protein O0X48_04695 [Methanocorpusculum sp.]|nr:hypothetical protein [Methanocorpusculum sp.]
MWKILKYLLPLFVVAALCGGTQERVADVHEGFMSEASLDALGCQSSISETESHLCLPRQITSGTNTNVQNAARRTNGAQRSSLEFAKAGKIINAGIKYLTTNIILYRSALYEPASRLSVLGRLII